MFYVCVQDKISEIYHGNRIYVQGLQIPTNNLSFMSGKGFSVRGRDFYKLLW